MRLSKLDGLRVGALLTAVFAVGGAACATAPTDEDDAASGGESAFTAGTSYDPYAHLDADLGEKAWVNEKNDIGATADIVESFLKRRYNAGRRDERGKVRYMRDAHAKTHGCVKGTFDVRDDVPSDLKVGVFASPHSWKTWVRYSNGNSEVRGDGLKDARGMAIKLTNVPGQKIVADFPEQSTQDFVMINHPVFFVDNPVQYAEALKVFHSGVVFEALGQFLSVVKLPLANAKLALDVNGSQIRNPLHEPYWSMAAFKLGNGKAVKFATIPVACGTEDDFPRDRAGQSAFLANARSADKTLIPLLQRDALRDAMQTSLHAGDACFVFALQRYVDADRTPVERTTVNWDDVAPFVPVASVHIPPQTFDTEAQDEFCDDLTFSPWHALPEHKPLGVVNRTRLVVYAMTSKLRREGNHVQSAAALRGPTGDEHFE